MKLGYRPELDGLRAIAVLAVMGFHFAKPVVSGGSLGVDVFFVLSGYLITSLLAAEVETTGRLDYPAFLLRRARRLLPALGVLLVAYWCAVPYLWPDLAGRRGLDVATAAFYVTNLRETFAPADTPLSHTWSLAIEEQFYLLWPLALLALLRKLSRQKLAALLLCGWGALTLARWVCLAYWPGPAAYYFTPMHATGLLLGSAVALRPLRFSWGLSATLGLCFVILFARTDDFFLTGIPAAEALAALVILNPPTALSAAPLCFLGRVSYGVYLWHVPISWALGEPGSIAAALYLAALSIAAGVVSHYGLEQWFLRRGATGVTSPVLS